MTDSLTPAPLDETPAPETAALALSTAADAEVVTSDVVALVASDRQAWMCIAAARDGSGRLCRKPRMIGQKICASHGGQAPQNLQAAWQRIREWTDPVLAQLIDTALSPSGFCETCGRQADALRLRAQIAVVDRALDARVPVEPGGAVITTVERIVIDASNAWEMRLTEDERAQLDGLREAAARRAGGTAANDGPGDDDDIFIV